jgi:hypothetical protein
MEQPQNQNSSIPSTNNRQIKAPAPACFLFADLYMMSKMVL